MSRRPLHICVDPRGDGLLASDLSGQILRLTADLAIAERSVPVPHGLSVPYMLKCDDQFIYARDMRATIAQWRTDDLSLVNLRQLKLFASEGARAARGVTPSVSHALHLHRGHLYAANSHCEIVRLDAQTLAPRGRLAAAFDAFPEGINSEYGGEHVISDSLGHLWWGSLDDGAFTRGERMDHGPVHCIRYDRRHDRFWITTDNHCGLALVDRRTRAIRRLRLTSDDCEWIAFSEDGERVAVACFDHYLYLFDNRAPEPRLLQRIGPFKFQLKQVLTLPGSRTYVLLESGEILRLDADGRVVARAATGTSCAWDLVPDPLHPASVLCPLEDGSIARVEYSADPEGGWSLREAEPLGAFRFGRVRRILALPDGDVIAGCSDGTVFRAARGGAIRWAVPTGGIVRDLDLGPKGDRCSVANEAGELLVLELERGVQLYRRRFEQPLWALCYRGDHVLCAERSASPDDDGAEASENVAALYQLDPERDEIVLRLEYSGNVKRIRTLPNGHILLNGNGGIAATELDLERHAVVQQWTAWQINTCEDACPFEDRIYTVTYGYQLLTYRHDGALIDMQFSAADYPKAVRGLYSAAGVPVLLVAGRGAYVSLYALRDGRPELAATLLLRRRAPED